jgi:hypothetical protein
MLCVNSLHRPAERGNLHTVSACLMECENWRARVPVRCELSIASSTFDNEFPHLGMHLPPASTSDNLGRVAKSVSLPPQHHPEGAPTHPAPGTPPPPANVGNFELIISWRRPDECSPCDRPRTIRSHPLTWQREPVRPRLSSVYTLPVTLIKLASTRARAGIRLDAPNARSLLVGELRGHAALLGQRYVPVRG